MIFLTGGGKGKNRGSRMIQEYEDSSFPPSFRKKHLVAGCLCDTYGRVGMRGTGRLPQQTDVHRRLPR